MSDVLLVLRGQRPRLPVPERLAQLTQRSCEPELTRRSQDQICVADALQRNERIGDRDAAHSRCMCCRHAVGGVLDSHGGTTAQRQPVERQLIYVRRWLVLPNFISPGQNFEHVQDTSSPQVGSQPVKR